MGLSPWNWLTSPLVHPLPRPHGLLPTCSGSLLSCVGSPQPFPGPTLAPGPLFPAPIRTLQEFLSHPSSQELVAPRSSLWVYALGQCDSCVMTHPGRAAAEWGGRGILPVTGQQPGHGWRSPWRSVGPPGQSLGLRHGTLPPFPYRWSN